MEKKTIGELKSFCRENNYKGFSKFTIKKDLLEFIKSKQSVPVSDIILPASSAPYINPTNIIPQTEKTLTEIQNEEYEMALQIDLERQKKKAYKAEIDKLYSQKLSYTELDKIRLARLNRFE